MKISLNWLKQYIEIPISPEKLGDILTAIGLEVEGMEEVESIPGGLKGVVVGHIIECGKHPNADRLSLTKLDVGGPEMLSVVCGAPNVAQGQKVLVATVGTILHPTEGDPLTIKKGKIRGEASEGMICAEDELGIGHDHDGIIVLPEETKVGTAAADYYKLETDIVYDIGLTPNRSDATSHIGVAKDVLAYFRINKIPSTELKLPVISGFGKDSDEHDHMKIIIEDEVGCPRFTAVSLSNVVVKESPDWIKNRLNSIGVRPISNIVDITNYILHETGQPLHAYDLDKITGATVRVKNLVTGTKFLSLDEKERTLNERDLMVCDGDSNGMCIAGVFGGAKSGVTDGTQNIFLEAAHFNAKRLRVTSTKHNLRTDAAMRFEKGSDPNMTSFALRRAALLMKEYANAQISSELKDVYPEEIKPLEVKVRYEKVNDLIGIELSKEKIEEILQSMEMDIVSSDESSFVVSVPTNKADVTREADVIEEILRIYGFNNVPIPSTLKTTISYETYPQVSTLRSVMANLLIGKGYYEAMNLSIVSSGLYEKVLPEYMDSLIYINNTSNIHLDVMRPEMMLPNLQTALYNQNRKNKQMRLFEFGRKYNQTEGEISEEEFLVILLKGSAESENWHEKTRTVDFYDVKRVVHEVLIKSGLHTHQTKEVEDQRFAFGLEYFRGDQVICKFGAVAQEVLTKMEISDPIYYAEFTLANLLKVSAKAKTKVSSISKFPAVRRDLALLIDDNVPFQQVKQLVAKADKKLIKDVGLFDVYKDDEQVGKGKKSIAISIILENDSKTLTDKEVEKVVKKVLGSLQHQLGATLR